MNKTKTKPEPLLERIKKKKLVKFNDQPANSLIFHDQKVEFIFCIQVKIICNFLGIIAIMVYRKLNILRTQKYFENYG